MSIYFRKGFTKCLCYECFYKICILKWEDLKIYQENGLVIDNETLITPSLISLALNIHHELFKYHYGMTPRTLKELSAREIFRNGKLNWIYCLLN